MKKTNCFYLVNETLEYRHERRSHSMKRKENIVHLDWVKTPGMRAKILLL